MNKHGFFTTLFMSVMGFVFIIVGIALIYLGIKVVVDDINIKNNGIVIKATITYRSRYSSDDSNYHRIEYTVNGEKYMGSFKSLSSSYKKGDIISIYCLKDNPKKILVPLESSNKGMKVLCGIVVTIFLIVLGGLCIKNYNIFKYKRVINVVQQNKL